jgi:hypothetical protein
MIARWQLYGVLAVAFVLGLLGIRARLLAEGEERLREKIATERRGATKQAQEVHNEVEALDRDALRGRATVWVRKPKR